jgi:hypothetical protein
MIFIGLFHEDGGAAGRAAWQPIMPALLDLVVGVLDEPSGATRGASGNSGFIARAS